jgi:hypothetical protein
LAVVLLFDWTELKGISTYAGLGENALPHFDNPVEAIPQVRFNLKDDKRNLKYDKRAEKSLK